MGRVEPDGPVKIGGPRIPVGIVRLLQTEPWEASVMASPRILDVAVIGGGVSGAYSAWRLKQARPDLKIGLFEYSDRIGGRLYTETLPGMPHVHAELGGMRFIPKTQLLVDNLIGFLELPTVPFPMGDPKPVGAANNLYYLRQKPIRSSNLTRPGEIPYNVSWNERGLDPDQLQAKVLNYLIPNNADLSPKDWFDVKEGEASIFRPADGGYKLVARIQMEEWPHIAVAAK